MSHFFSPHLSPPPMEFNLRGKCMSPDCRSGCMASIPRDLSLNLDPPQAPPAHPGLRKCAICVAACYAAQHAEMVQSQPAPAPKSVPRPQPPSATLNNMHTARGFAAPVPGPSTASPFRVHVKRRQEDIETNRKQNSTPGHPFQSKKFHPAERSQINGDLNPHDSRALSASSHRYTSPGPQHNQAGYAKRTEMVEDRTPLSHLESFNSMKALLADLIDSTVAEQLSVDILFAKLAKHVLVPLESLNALATHIRSVGEDAKSRAELRREFDKVFGLGPGGFTVVFLILSFLYEGLARIRKAGFALKTAESFETDHFRLTYHRFLWDPKGGFRELAHVLQRYDDKNPVGDPQNAMHVPLDNIALQLDSSSSLRQSLEDAFESATDAGNMKHAVVIGGEYGLRRFYAVVIEQLLDTIDRTDYEDVFKLLNDTSRALARKCANYVKSKPGPGAKPKPSPVPEDENGPRTRTQTAGASAPRNSKSGHFKTPREPNEQLSIAAALDMTGTESATEFWYRNLRPGPGIKTRRNRRHTTEYAASSENEDYMPKPPPKPKGCWVDVNSSPSPSPPPAPPSSEEQHNLDLEDAEDLMTLEWFGLRRRILKRLPHPNPQKRDTLKDLNQLNHTQQFRQLSKANQNVTQSARWQEVTTKIMTAINDKRR
ncbi:hypothetical protein C8J57DRAFT_1502432 [Mycena rebaudengoi]|nr:hypothetical protein C8J57DRAFT_1502432 [Mycena rebaudengoi]